MPLDNIWSYWAEENPQALYNAMIPTSTPAQQKYWGNQYGDVWQSYMGKLAKMALGGNPPNLNFSEYLGTYPWTEYWNQLSPNQRGYNPYLSSSIRWNI